MRDTDEGLRLLSLTHPNDRPEDGRAELPVFDADGALSRAFLLQRGFCCDLGCKNCPYKEGVPGAIAAGEMGDG